MALTPLDKNGTGGNSHSTNNPSDETNYDDACQLPKDLVFGMLSNERRRWALKYLAGNDNETTLSDLAEYIASIENDKPEAALTSDERKRVYVGLYQVHLPKMDDADIIDYNQARGTIELQPEADQLLTYITPPHSGSEQTKSWYHRLLPTLPLNLIRDQ